MVEEPHAQAKDERNQPSAFTNPMMTIVVHLNGTVLEGASPPLKKGGRTSFNDASGKTSRSLASF
jgi:hypothetical protein